MSRQVDLSLHRDQIEAATEEIITSGVLGEKSRLRELLRFVVDETLEGRSDHLKAYTIGTLGLGRGDDFDPSSDSIVRVEMNRLRQALDHFYATQGATQPLRIIIPKGTYKPSFEFVEVEQPEPVEPAVAPRRLFPLPSTWAVRAGLPVFAGMVGLLLLCGLVILLIRQYGEHYGLPVDLGGDELSPPIIEVERFANNITDPEFRYFADGIQVQLVSDLSHFRTLRIRSVPAFEESRQIEVHPAADYRIGGAVSQIQDNIRLTMTLSDADTANVIWSTTRDFDVVDDELWSRMLTSVRTIVAQIGAPTGIMEANGLRHIELQERIGAFEGGSSYECLLQWHAYDATKSQLLELKVHKCLNELIENDTQDASIWAAYALMRFLDWSKQSDLEDRTALIEGLEAARQAIRLDPTDASGHEYMGNILMAQGALDEARKCYEWAVTLNPSKADPRVMLGWNKIRRGMWDEGVEDIYRGIGMSPNPPGWFRIPLSVHYYRQGDFQRAFNQAEIIISTGDERGIPLALAAAVRLGAEREIVRLTYMLRNSGLNTDDPMSSIRSVLNIPEIISMYEADINSLSFN